MDFFKVESAHDALVLFCIGVAGGAAMYLLNKYVVSSVESTVLSAITPATQQAAA